MSTRLTRCPFLLSQPLGQNLALCFDRCLKQSIGRLDSGTGRQRYCNAVWTIDHNLTVFRRNRRWFVVKLVIHMQFL